ncbi:T9SS C-terminal target domain-containing protein [Dyadobacter sp. CY345]|uniref:sialate O-acetylesterase n=1 Tax=Dyadobacter sp. CY345 TaxID=2909335 RepID=UPI001F257492|nr:sialate O-acetylesterase [Dyadobacter sp. CY345]MCF2445474.1 T9SS C-terminal target domain-containing protein [Dyadobacter sp. CY345]
MTEFVLRCNYRLSLNLSHRNLLLTFLFFLSCCLGLRAQLVIKSPINNQVLQRDKSGFAEISVTAYAYVPYESIEAKLTPIQGNIAEIKSLSFSKSQIDQGFLTATFEAKTGWYELQLTGYAANGTVDISAASRVGIGEVFLVAGNSNAMGLPDLGSKNSSDQVVTFNAINKFLNADNITVAPDEPMQAPQFAPIKAKDYIFPSGETSWYWAELGDMLNKKLNTPVLFLNSAWAAANSENYRDGASGKDAFNVYVGKFWPNRQPYTNIINTVRYLNSSLGLRAILWSHGENDAQQGVTEENYFNNIRTLITNSRRDTGKDIPWIIARNSASSTLPKPYVPVITAQNRIISLDSFNTYAGPNLDTVQMPRPQQGHFENIAGGVQGLTLAASAWNRILTDSLMDEITPLQPSYAIHTGVTPFQVFPGASFTLPFDLTGLPASLLSLQAELLDSAGRFVAIVGAGNQTPLKIQIPQEIKNGQYRIRLTGLNPVLTGSVSDHFSVSSAYTEVDFINKLTARTVDNKTHLAWLIAAVPGLKQIVIQVNNDGESFSDIKTFDPDNETNSQIFSHIDENDIKTSSFYRLKLEYENGEVGYSAVYSIFREGSPANLVIFPNPVTKQYFYFRADEDIKLVKCALFDARGNEHPIRVSDNEIVGLVRVEPAHPLPSGNYFLKVITESGVIGQTVLFY